MSWEAPEVSASAAAMNTAPAGRLRAKSRNAAMPPATTYQPVGLATMLMALAVPVRNPSRPRTRADSQARSPVAANGPGWALATAAKAAASASRTAPAAARAGRKHAGPPGGAARPEPGTRRGSAKPPSVCPGGPGLTLAG
jgi:hypothetical protein